MLTKQFIKDPLKRRYLYVVAGLFSLCAMDCFAAQTTNAYKPPRTEHGKPDLQGVWTNSSVTDLERPAGIQKLVLTPQEATQWTNTDDLVERVRTDKQPVNPVTGLLDGSDLAAGRGYNSFWIDPGTQVGRVRGELRSSWIIDPTNGKIPYSTAGRDHVARMRHRAESYDGPEVRPLGDRCLATTGRTGPPMVNGLYNNHYQIVQTRDRIVILNEMVQHARTVRLNSEHIPTTMRPLFGDSIGWWDGDTLVVETTNFHPLHSMFGHPAYLTERGKVTERFTRYSESQILYEFVVEDPTLYTQPWRGELAFNKAQERIFEYACHEGNYAMIGILAGAREQEKKSEK
jgi:hypothetical protein